MRNRDCAHQTDRRAWTLAAAAGIVAFAALLPLRLAAQIQTTTVQGTVYRADGTPASGTLLISWPAFTTPQNQAVAAGTTSATIGTDGFVSVNLTPNAGSLPQGNYYTANYHLSDGTVNSEYWVVPAAGTAAIASVRAELQPSTVAVQPVTQTYVQNAIASLSGTWLPLAGGTLSGPLALSSDPTASSQAATKHYADQLAAAQLPLAGGTLAGPLTVPNLYAKQLEGRLYADQQQSSSGSNNGIAMSLQQCLTYTYACQVIAPALYAQTEAQPWGGSFQWMYPPYSGGAPETAPTGGGYVDDRWGAPQWVYTAGLAIPGGDVRHSVGPAMVLNEYRPLGATQNGSAAPALTLQKLQLANSWNWNGNQTYNETLLAGGYQYSGGSWNNVDSELYASSPGDHIVLYSRVFDRGGVSNADGEGTETRSVLYEASDVFEGTLNGTSTNPSDPLLCRVNPCTVFSTTRTQGGNGSLGSDLEITDLTRADSTGYISNIAYPGIITATGADWDSVYGDSTFYGTLSSSASPGGSGPASITVSIATTFGSPTTSSPVCLFDYSGRNWECEVPTAASPTSLTLLLRHNFQAGSVVAQGGMTGMGLSMQADWVGPGSPYGGSGAGVSGFGSLNNPSNIIRPVFPIMYNLSGNVVHAITGNRNGFGTRAYPSMGSGGAVSATVSGGAVTACSASGGSGYNASTTWDGYAMFPPQLTYSANPAWTTYPLLAIRGEGANGLSSCVVVSGGTQGSGGALTVTVTPTNPYAVYPMAHIVNAWNPSSGQLDGSSIAVDNPMPSPSAFHTGDTLEVPHYFANATTQWNSQITGFQPSSITNGVETYIGGVFGGNNYGYWIQNMNQQSMYSNFPGGTTPWQIGWDSMGTPYGYTLSGAWLNGIYLKSPPFGMSGGGGLSGAVVVGCFDYVTQTNICTKWLNPYNVLNVRNTNNNQQGEDVLQYTPTTQSWTWTAGATSFSGANSACSVSLAGSGNAGLSVTCNGATSRFDNAGNLSVAGTVHALGTVTGASINGEVTVDGTTYTTLNAAWTAAVTQANSTGHNQTVRLGPGTFPVTATLTEPTNGACVSLLGTGGTTVNADSSQPGTTLTVPSSLGGDVVFLGNTVQAQGCTFKDLNLLAGNNATHGFELQWFRGALIDNVAVNDTTAEGILLGEETTTSGHQANFLLRNVTVSYSSSAFTPANRPAWGVHLEKTAIDSHLDNITVRNALTAAVDNEGTGNTGYLVHGFGYPYTCTTAPCANNASSGTAANASYATSYVIYDTGGSGSVWTDTYADSPAVSGFYVGANGVEIHGGHVQWPDLTSFPAANLAYVASTVTNNLLIADVDCLEMASGVNWITYAGASGNPPTYTSVHHLTGCGNYYQALEDANVTGYSSGGANINDPTNAVPRVWSTPVASAASYPAYAAQLYTGYQGDVLQAHFSGVNPFFNVTYQGTIRSSGGIALSTFINTASTLTLTAANKNVIANAAGGAQTITLPSCYTALPDKASPTGLEFTIIKSDTSANAVTLQTVSSQNINYNGVSAQTLAISAAGKRTLVCAPDYNWYAY